LRKEEIQVRKRVEELVGEEAGRGVIADTTVAPKNVLAIRHTAVQAHHLPENIINLEGRN
jgi:hypothetical protein